MFGNINTPNRNHKSDEHDSSSRSIRNESAKNIRFIKSNINSKTPKFQDDATYSSDDESEDKSTKKSNVNKQKITELDLLKKENEQLKMSNETLMKLSNLSESTLKISSLMIEIFNEQKLINARLEKLENESRKSSKTKRLDDDILPIGDNSSSDLPAFGSDNLTKSAVNDNSGKKVGILPTMTNL